MKGFDMGEVGDFDCRPLTPSEELSFRNKNRYFYMLLLINVHDVIFGASVRPKAIRSIGGC